MPSESQIAHAALDLGSQQLRVVAEIALERVALDDDVVPEVVASDGAADVVAVCVMQVAEIGDEDRDSLDHLAQVLGQAVDRLDDELVELAQRLLGRGQLGQRLARSGVATGCTSAG